MSTELKDPAQMDKEISVYYLSKCNPLTVDLDTMRIEIPIRQPVVKSKQRKEEMDTIQKCLFEMAAEGKLLQLESDVIAFFQSRFFLTRK